MFHFLVSNGIGIVTGKEFGPGGVALGGVIKLSKTKAVFSELVKVGSVDFSAKAPEVGVAHVVDHDYNEIGFSAGILSLRIGKP
jgi:hypothetical protein